MAIDLVGQTYGRFTVLRREGLRGKEATWECRCVCGELRVVTSNCLRMGHTKSCGCLQREKAADHCREMSTHGHSKRTGSTPEYQAWAAMWTRCTNPNAKNWKRYGGRGIRVCARWESFENFLADVGPRPLGRNGSRPKFTLDRKDNDGDYEPGNVRWATYLVQQSNRGNNRWIVVNEQRHTLTQWAKIAGISSTTLRDRINRGWPIERAVTQTGGPNGRKRSGYP